MRSVAPSAAQDAVCPEAAFYFSSARLRDPHCLGLAPAKLTVESSKFSSSPAHRRSDRIAAVRQTSWTRNTRSGGPWSQRLILIFLWSRSQNSCVHFAYTGEGANHANNKHNFSRGAEDQPREFPRFLPGLGRAPPHGLATFTQMIEAEHALTGLDLLKTLGLTQAISPRVALGPLRLPLRERGPQVLQTLYVGQLPNSRPTGLRLSSIFAIG